MNQEKNEKRKTCKLLQCHLLDESICHLGVSGSLVDFILFLMENPVSKQWRPWSKATLYSVWSESALFAFLRVLNILSFSKYEHVTAQT